MAPAQAVLASIGSVITVFQTGGIQAGFQALLTAGEAAFTQLATAAATWVTTALPALLTNLVTMRGQMLGSITTALPGWLTVLAQFGAAAGAWVMAAMPAVLHNIGTLFQTLINQTVSTVPVWAGTLLQFGIKAVSWIVEALPGLTRNLTTFISSMLNWVVASLPAWAAQLGALGLKAIQWVSDALPGLGKNLGTMTGQLLAWVIQTIADLTPKLADMAAKFISWVATEVMPKLPGVLANIGTGILQFILEVTKAVLPLLGDLAFKFIAWVGTDVIPKLPGALATIGTSIGSWIVSAASQIGTEAASIGADLVGGIEAGISNAWGRFMSWIAGKIAELPAPVREALGIHSPSTVFADEVGKHIPSGIALGIEQATPVATAAVAAMVEQITNGSRITLSELFGGKQKGGIIDDLTKQISSGGSGGGSLADLFGGDKQRAGGAIDDIGRVWNSGAVSPAISPSQLLMNQIGSQVNQSSNTFNLTAQYQTQDRQSLINDVRMLQARHG